MFFFYIFVLIFLLIDDELVKGYNERLIAVAFIGEMWSKSRSFASLWCVWSEGTHSPLDVPLFLLRLSSKGTSVPLRPHFNLPFSHHLNMVDE